MRAEDVHGLAVEAGLDHEAAVTATAVAWAESHLDPDAIGDENREDATWGPSIGLWQIRSLRAHKGTGRERDADRLRDPAFNARAMATISDGGANWQPWSVYRNGAYRQYLDDVRSSLNAGGKPMAVVRGGRVLPHVQAFADACQDATGVASFGTYNGHDPDITRALDIFVPVHDAGPGNAVCDFAIDNWDDFGLWYIIFRQQIYNPSIADRWRQMEDRGGVTQNHYDHVHASFRATGAARPTPTRPEPTPTGGFLMALSDRQQQEMYDSARLAGQIAALTAGVFNELGKDIDPSHPWEAGAAETARLLKKLQQGGAPNDR